MNKYFGLKKSIISFGLLTLHKLLLFEFVIDFRTVWNQIVDFVAEFVMITAQYHDLPANWAPTVVF